MSNVFAADELQNSKGVASVKELILSAKKELSDKKVYSKAYPLRFVSRTVRNSVIHRLFVAENANKAFINDKLYLLYEHVEKFGMEKLSSNKSNMGAHGVMQITEGTFDTVKKLYPRAGIGKSFHKEVANPRTSMKLAILVVDNALAALPYEDRKRVMNDDDLYHDYVAAAYNGGPGTAITLLKKGTDFAEGSRGETKNYIEKVRMARNLVPV